MGSSGGGTQTTVQQADPWVGQRPYLRDVFAQAQNQYYNQQPQYFPGSTVAPIDPSTVQAQNYADALAAPGGLLPNLSTTAGQSAIFNLGAARDVQSNPYLQSAIQAAFTPTIQAFTDPGGTLSQARTQFQNAGQFGSSRHALGEGIAYGRLGQTLADTASRMASEGYTTGLDASIRQQALLPQTQQGILGPVTVGEAAGQSRESYAQQLIDAALNRWNFEQNIPSASLAQYQNLIQGNYGGTGTTTMQGPTQNRAMGVLGGAAAGAAAGSAFGPWGTGIGAIIGGIIGGFR